MGIKSLTENFVKNLLGANSADDDKKTKKSRCADNLRSNLETIYTSEEKLKKLDLDKSGKIEIDEINSLLKSMNYKRDASTDESYEAFCQILRSVLNSMLNPEEQKSLNSKSSSGSKAVSWAEKFEGYSQSKMKSIFKENGYQFDAGAWCADFTYMALCEGLGKENLPDWYKSVSNKAYCPSIYQKAKGHEVSADKAKSGDIVLFDWNGDGTPDHVGIFVKNEGGGTITTIEGNTSGSGGSSCVSKKQRKAHIMGIYSMS